MPTLNWIQETGWDRYWERGNEKSEFISRVYTCRVCGNIFNSMELRDSHEVEHPVSNPTIFIDGKEVCGDQVNITAPITTDSIFLRDIDRLVVNGDVYDTSQDFLSKILENKIAFLDVFYGNSNIERRLKISICIADREELKQVKSIFLQCFEDSGINNKKIVYFAEKIQGLQTVKVYCDGLVRYLQGIMAKDNHPDAESFDFFLERFNQASQALKQYDTDLAHAVRSVINFNINDFAAVIKTGLPFLDSAVEFFKGGSVVEFNQSQTGRAFPVDCATDIIVSDLLKYYSSSSLDDIRLEIIRFPSKYISLQDRMKLNYILYRKSIQVDDMESAKHYRKKLSFDDVFSEMVGPINE